MASEVDICNIALGYLGDLATVASIDPPEGSAQAEHCARFYPMARDGLLQAHAWSFATKRIQPAQMGAPPTGSGWTFAYARPTDALDLLAVQRPETPDRFERQEYVCELGADGHQVIYCNVENAVVRYVSRVKDTTRFPPLFSSALTWQLASLLAGPILKGDAGAAEAKRCAQMAAAFLAQAATHDANQSHLDLRPTPDWLGGRGPGRVPGSTGWGR